MEDDVRMKATTAPPILYGPYLDAPTWPWLVAGWTASAVFLLLFVIAWTRA